MNKRITSSMIRIVPLCLLLILSYDYAFALNEATHSKLNENLAKKTYNNFSLDKYLKDSLGNAEGVNQFNEEYRLWEWIYWGGTYEDSRPVPTIYPRSYYHFHDPTKPLTDAGFSGEIVGLPIHNADWKSSIMWALEEFRGHHT